MSTHSPLRDRRPLSPHLSIYKPQITSALSIFHRMTGAFLFLGIIALAWWIVVSVYSNVGANMDLLPEFFGTILGKLLLLAWSASLFYHLLNGIRHLFWDAGYGFEIRTVTKTGIAVLLGTVILTGLSWYFALYY